MLENPFAFLFPTGVGLDGVGRSILFDHARNNDVFVRLLEVTLDHSRRLFTFYIPIFLAAVFYISPCDDEIGST